MMCLMVQLYSKNGSRTSNTSRGDESRASNRSHGGGSGTSNNMAGSGSMAHSDGEGDADDGGQCS